MVFSMLGPTIPHNLKKGNKQTYELIFGKNIKDISQ